MIGIPIDFNRNHKPFGCQNKCTKWANFHINFTIFFHFWHFSGKTEVSCALQTMRICLPTVRLADGLADRLVDHLTTKQVQQLPNLAFTAGCAGFLVFFIFKDGFEHIRGTLLILERFQKQGTVFHNFNTLLTFI
jgi:hypothetical protein